MGNLVVRFWNLTRFFIINVALLKGKPFFRNV